MTTDDLPAAVITAEMVAAAHDYDIAHRDDPGQPVRGRWWRPPDDQVRRLLTGAAPHITAAQRVWRRGADGRWPDGHKCGGCTGPDSELCDCCADACECVEPSLAIVQAVAAATAAERQRIRQLAEQHKAHTWTQHVNHDNPGDSYWAEEPFAELLREDTP